MDDPERTVDVGPPGATPALDIEGHRALAAVTSRLTGREHDTRIGRYVLQRHLGEGGFGAVFLARDPELDREVAIKVVRERATDDPHARERLGAEARALAQLRDRNVVQVFDVGTDDIGGTAHLYIVMELLAGPTLDAWIRQRSPTPAEIVDAFAQAARGLAAAHSVGVVHRDFKPTNAMFTAEGCLKVLDFGLAAGEGARPTDPSVEVPTRLTQTGLVMGTPRYMAPEQHAARGADERSDQYALCVALWEALSGAPPFPGKTVASLATEKREGAPPRPAAMPRHLYRVLVRGLAPDPSRRFSSMAALTAALKRPRRAPRLALGVAALGLAGLAALPLDDTLALCEQPSPMWSGRFEDVIAAATPERTSAQWGLQSEVARRLDRFDAQWGQARAEVCGDPPPSLPVARRVAAACLQRGAQRFETLLAAADEDDAQARLRRGLLPLAVPSRCLGPDAATAFVLDPAREAAIDRIDATLTPGDDEPDLAVLDALWTEAEQLGSPWLLTRIGQWRAAEYLERGQSREAAAALDAAVWQAESAGDVLLAAEVLPGAIGHLVDAGFRPDELQPWFARGYRLLDAAGRPPGPTARLLVVDAITTRMTGGTEAALAKADEALDLVGEHPPPGAEGQVALAIQVQIGFRFAQMSADELEVACRRVLALGLPTDSWYPAMAAISHHVLAEAAFRKGEVKRATAERLQQLGWLSRLTSVDTPPVQLALAGYDRMLAYAGAPELALAQMELAYDRVRNQGGGFEGRLQLLAADLTEVDLELGRFEQARYWAQQQVDNIAIQLGENHPDITWPRLDLARALIALGRLEEAKTQLAASIPLLDPADAPTIEDLQRVRGELAVAEGRWRDALDALQPQQDAIDPANSDPHKQSFRADICAALHAAYAGVGDTTQAALMQTCLDDATRRAGNLRMRRAPATSRR